MEQYYGNNINQHRYARQSVNKDIGVYHTENTKDDLS